MKNGENYNSMLSDIIKNMLGGNPKVRRFSNEDLFWTKAAGWKQKLNFDILKLDNTPENGVTIYSTLGLSEYELRDEQNNNKPRRIELVTVIRDDTDFLELTGDIEDQLYYSEDLLMYLSCYLVFEKSYLYPGDIWINWFSKYDRFSDLEHLFFIYPTMIMNEWNSTIIDDKEIEWILCVPITQAELEYYEENGAEELEKLLLQKKINVSDLFRDSVV
jgi:antitoxin YqcF